MKQRERIAVLFGGRSVEHEISIITSLQLLKAMDTTRYEPVPVYIAPSGRWYTDVKLFNRDNYPIANFEELTEVTVLPTPDIGGLTVLEPKRSWSLRGPKKGSVIPIDVFLLGFHGEFGEDGCIQGLLELAGATYTGNDVLGSSVAMNKYVCKVFLEAHGISVLPSMVIRKSEAQKDIRSISSRIFSTKGIEKYPVFIKPNHLGSSVGIAKANNDDELVSALATVFKYDFEALVEPFLSEMFEVNVSVMDGDPLRASAVEIPVSDSGVLSYEEKYMRGGKKKAGPSSSDGMASLTRVINPKDLSVEIKQQVIESATKAFDLLYCSGVGRFDFMVDKATGEVYFNELNPMPGSFSFYLWIESEPSVLYTEEVTRMIKQAKSRRAMKASLDKNFGFKALRG
ncbi:MAG: hypothetical protein KDD62_05245 [Bdellovibrionales bacterium]|nr:hypothetical protein [Bdellovibrionales bacterium]